MASSSRTRAPAPLVVCGVVPASWAAVSIWFSVAGAASGEQHPLVLLTGPAVAAAAVGAAVLLARREWASGLGLLAVAGLGPGPGEMLPTAAVVVSAAGLVCVMAVLLEPPGRRIPRADERP